VGHGDLKCIGAWEEINDTCEPKETPEKEPEWKCDLENNSSWCQIRPWLEDKKCGSEAEPTNCSIKDYKQCKFDFGGSGGGFKAFQECPSASFPICIDFEEGVSWGSCWRNVSLTCEDDIYSIYKNTGDAICECAPLSAAPSSAPSAAWNVAMFLGPPALVDGDGAYSVKDYGEIAMPQTYITNRPLTKNQSQRGHHTADSYM